MAKSTKKPSGAGSRNTAASDDATFLNDPLTSAYESPATSTEDQQARNNQRSTPDTRLPQKNDTTQQLSEDFHNFLIGFGVKSLFLDQNLNVMRITPAACDMFQVTASDLGRPFTEIAGNLRDPKLLEDTKSVLQDLQTIKREVSSEDGKWFARHITPCLTKDDKIDGIVITYADVTEVKDLQRQLETALKFSESIVDAVREPMLIMDGQFRIMRANPSFLSTFGTTAESVEGHQLFKIAEGKFDQSELKKLLKRVLADEAQIEDYKLEIGSPGQPTRTCLVNARQVRNGKENDKCILLAAEEITHRLRTQQGLEERDARLSALLDAAPEAIITTDNHGTISSYSPAARTILGYTAQEIMGQNVKMLMPEPHRAQHDGYMAHYLETGDKKIIGKGRELTARRKDGSEVPIHLTVAEWHIGDQRNFVGILHDLSEDMKRRKALQQAQKMYAIGQLTGGLAHDFNNLLTVIIGNLELLELKMGDFDGADLLKDALEASDLGAKLTSQLLAFSRKQELAPVPISLNELVIKLKPILSRTLGDQIYVATNLADDLSPTLSDPGQIENVILNLAINARDAMPEGGTLTIETKNVVLDANFTATQIDVEPGSYIALSVADTGAGMAPETIERAFEPFFTTKGVGEGSGLGLSMVYGFAKQSGGHATICSETGIGTTVTVYLRPASPGEETIAIREPAGIPEKGSETILVVEDDARVRRLTISRLESLGYDVLQAQDGPSALEILRSDAKIDLVLSDIVMPGGINGFQVADQALAVNPALRILLTTGYASGANAEQAGSGKRHPLLRKPYSLSDLSDALRSLFK